MRENKLGKFYLILTDTLNTKTPWWMPAALFEIIDANMPTTWVSRQWRGYGKELAHCHPDFFMFEQDIEDGTDQGKLIFARIKKQQD